MFLKLDYVLAPLSLGHVVFQLLFESIFFATFFALMS